MATFEPRLNDWLMERSSEATRRFSSSLIPSKKMSASSGANKRLINEVTKLKALAHNCDSSGMRFLLERSPLDDPRPDSENILLGRILPTAEVYANYAFQIEIKLPAEYPFKSPEVRIVTPIYHPNVDDKGKICVDLLNSSETWKPTTPLVDVVKAVVDLIDNPKIDHALNPGETKRVSKRKKKQTLLAL